MKRGIFAASAKAHTDLSMFAAGAAMLEGGSTYTASGTKAAQKIIAICRKEHQHQLKAYDAGMVLCEPKEQQP